jgi:hypothetical protein
MSNEPEKAVLWILGIVATLIVIGALSSPPSGASNGTRGQPYNNGITANP